MVRYRSSLLCDIVAVLRADDKSDDVQINAVMGRKAMVAIFTWIMYVSVCVRGAGSGGESVLCAGGGQLRSTRYTPPSPGRAVPVTVDDDLESVWAEKMNGVVTSGSDVDDNSSSLSSSIADPHIEYDTM